jgi:hypothetical protein
VKMAIAIVPEDSLLHFARTIDWLMVRDPVTCVSQVQSAICYIYSFPVQVPNAAALLRRTTDDMPLPHMLFTLTLERLMFCIHLPLSALDECFAGQIQFGGMGPVTVSGKRVPCTVLQLASAEIVKDRMIDFSLRYESRQERDKAS